MKKAIIAVIGLAVLGVAGFFGFQHWVQSRARAEVEAVFADLRRSGATAAYRDVAFELRSRTLTVSGISLKSADGAATLKAERLVARGVSEPAPGRLDAAELEVDLLQVTAQGAMADGGSVSYAVPRVHVEGYSGPTTILSVPEGNSRYAALRTTVKHLSAMRARRVSIPDITARVAGGGAQTPYAIEAAYADLVAEGLDSGRLARLAIARATYGGTAPTGDTVGLPPVTKITGAVADVALADMDAAPLLALTDPGAAATDGYRQLIGRLTTGAYALAQEPGTRMTWTGMTLDGLGLRPSALSTEQVDTLNTLAMKGKSLTPDEARRLAELAADGLDAVSLAALTIHGLDLTDATGTGHFDTMELKGIGAGRLESIAFTGMKAVGTDNSPVTAGRIAVSGLALGQALKRTADAAATGTAPTADEAPALFQLISGFEVEKLEAPYDDGGRRVRLGALSLKWGDVLGALPSRLSFRLTDLDGPISAADGEPFTYLANAGITSATVSMALDIAYDEKTSALSLSPAFAEVKQAFSVRIDAQLAGIPKSAFASEAEATDAIMQATGGPITLTLKNLGLAELMLKQLAEADGVTPEALRADMARTVDEITAAADNPDLLDVAAALKAFIAEPRTLTITLTPRTPLPLLPTLLAEGLDGAAAAYTISAAVGP